METVNSFEGGLNKDTNLAAINNSQYLSAFDIDIVGDKDHGSAKPVRGSRKSFSIVSKSTYGLTSDFSEADYSKFVRIMGCVECKVVSGGKKLNGFAIFVGRAKSLSESPLGTIVNNSNEEIFEIYLATVPESSFIQDFQKVYSRTREKTSFSSKPNPSYLSSYVDSELAGDSDLDIIYLTNQVDSPMRVRCTLDEFTASKPSFNDQDILLIRQANTTPPFLTVREGGSLTSGTYQFAARMVNSVSNLHTKWSLLSNPIPLAANKEAELNSEGTSSGGVGEISGKKIEVYTYFNQEIFDGYDYYQLAVVKGTNGSGIPKLNAYTLEPIFKGSANDIIFNYIGEEVESEISIDELVVDDAQIESFNTIAIKNNFLIGGGVKYEDLDYDNGDPIVSSSSDYSINNGYTYNDLNSYDPDFYNEFDFRAYKSFFRDEVYRFAVVYHDANGNWSSPKVLDFSSSSNNKAESGCVDWKFPTLYEEPITGSSLTNIRSIKMEIKGIQNHPSWAKGFAILRAKRIKDIQFQAPVLPTTVIQPMIATEIYPQAGLPLLEDAQPPEGVLGTLAPKNMSQGLLKHIVRGDMDCHYAFGYPTEVVSQSTSGGTWTVPNGGTASSKDVSCLGTKYVHCIFPPNNLYNSSGNYYEPYTQSSSDSIEVVDIQYFESDQNILNNETVGTDLLSKRDVGIAYSYVTQLDKNFTRYGSGNVNVSTLSFVDNNDNKVLQYSDVQAGIDKVVVTASAPGLDSIPFGDYSSLVASGLEEGYPAINNAMGLMVSSSPMVDPIFKFIDGSVSLGTLESALRVESGLLATTSGMPTVNGSTILTASEYGDESPSDNNPHKFAQNQQYPGDFSYNYIVNIRKGLSDFRYGGSNDFHEYIFTGVYDQLSDQDVSTNIAKNVSVYGGDCSISLHSFKVYDTSYSLPSNADYEEDGNNPDDETLRNSYMRSHWGSSFVVVNAKGNRDYEIGRPIPVKANSSVITVLLESEIDARYSNKLSQRYKRKEGSSTPSIESISEARTPFFYQYNLDYSLPNYNKIFVTDFKLGESQTIFNSRLAYSDERIYQSRDIGFDRFRVANTYDMDEANGSITRLIEASDRLYAIQSGGVAYIPVLGQVVESTDSGTLAVRSQDVIGIPQYASTVYGGSDFGAITKISQGFVFVDSGNKAVLELSSNGLTAISDVGVKEYFDAKLFDYNKNESASEDSELFALYDPGRKDLYIMSSNQGFGTEGWMINYSKLAGKWVSEFTSSSHFYGINGVYVNGNLLMVGKFNDTDMAIHVFRYDGNLGESYEMLGKDLNPSIQFVINDNPTVSKVFDVFNISSEYKLKDIQLTTNQVYRSGSSVEASQTTGMNIEQSSLREGRYTIPITRNQNLTASLGGRMKGMFGTATVNWGEGSLELSDRASLYNITTRYRITR